jgi:hypothetical protein
MTARLTILLGFETCALVDATYRRLLGGVVADRFPEMRGPYPLHPSLHGAVADRIILDATHPTLALPKHRVVCTHSDPFVLRIRRRIAEGTLSPADVALVWVLPDGSETSIQLNDRGTPEWWPKGVGYEAQDEFHAIRRALAARDLAAAKDVGAALPRAEQPTMPEEQGS